MPRHQPAVIKNLVYPDHMGSQSGTAVTSGLKIPVRVNGGGVQMLPIGDDGVIAVEITRADLTQVWCAFYSDRSGMALFADEIDALRYAVGSSMSCKKVTLGADLIEQL